MYELWPTAERMSSRDISISSTCLRCKKSIESFNHVYQCTSRGATSAFRVSFHSLPKDLKLQKTAAPIIYCFKIFFLAFQKCSKPECPQYKFGDKKKFLALQRAFQHQSLLGPASLQAGYLSYKWSLVQSLYISNSFNTRYNVPWAAQVIRSIWKFSSSLWLKRRLQVHKKVQELDASLTTEELKHTIRSYLRLSRTLLSPIERKFHDNVRRHLLRASSTTLA